MYKDDGGLIGINKTICSKIRLKLDQSDIEEINFYTNPDGDLFPEKDLPESSRILQGFIWRGDERIRSKDEIFDADDNNLTLPVIRGITEPIDREAPDEEDSPEDPVSPRAGNTQGVLPTEKKDASRNQRI